VKTEGSMDAASADVRGRLAALMAAGQLEIPTVKIYPLDRFAMLIKSLSSVIRVARSWLSPD
jgi:hypothetical protein